MDRVQLAAAVLCGITLAIAMPAAAQDPRFDAQSRLVLVPVTVTGEKGRFVDGLKASDFVLLDNGQPQTFALDTIGTGMAPVALVIAVQSSGVAAGALEVLRTIPSMIQPFVTGERGCAALVSFDEEIKWLQKCTHDTDALTFAFHRLEPGGGPPKTARMLDAASEAIASLRERPNTRRVLLLISESRDRGSETELETVLLAAQTSDVTVYAATYSAFKTSLLARKSEPAELPKTPPPPDRPPPQAPPAGTTPYPTPPEQRIDILGGIGELLRLRDPNTTEILAAATGGATFRFTRRKGIEKIIMTLGAELHGQYLLSFAPDAPADGLHRLEVRIPAGPKYAIRSRPGYWWMDNWPAAPPGRR